VAHDREGRLIGGDLGQLGIAFAHSSQARHEEEGIAQYLQEQEAQRVVAVRMVRLVSDHCRQLRFVQPIGCGAGQVDASPDESGAECLRPGVGDQRHGRAGEPALPDGL